MKSITASAVFALGLVAVSEAYPNIAAHLAEQKAAKRDESLLQKIKKRTTWSPSQLIDVSGEYAFVAPSDTDQRGPCPGLNALANHNYLPHNGVATIQQYIDATNSVFGMGEDLALFLSAYGAAIDGDGVEWSMGGPTSAVGSLTDLLGTPQGISGSHNKYEGDSSPTRGDLYEYGNDYEVVLSQFQALYDLGKAANSYDLDILTTFRSQRFQQSIENNPYFFYGPFSGVIVSPAAYTFIFRYMGNKSEEYPEGYLDGDVLKSFFSITGNDGDFVYTPGYEHIPENWYTRAADDPYGIAGLVVDTEAMGLEYPEFLVPGGNLGTKNSYVGLDPSNLTGGLYSLGDLTEGNNALCFGFQATYQFLPDLVQGLVSNVVSFLAPVNSVLSSAASSLGCPSLEAIDNDQYADYPGFTSLNGETGTYSGESAQ